MCITLGLLNPSDTRANPSLAQAREAGLLTVEEALLYEIYQAVDPALLPEEYRSSTLYTGACVTTMLVEAREAESHMSVEYGRALAKVLARPSLQTSVLTPSGHFRVHYSTSGFDAVDSTDADGNDIPDYIDLTSSVLDSVWRLEVDVLGYKVPKSDEGVGGGTEYDVYVQELGRTGTVYYGLTVPEQGGLPTTTSYMRIDNNFTDPTYGSFLTCNGARGTRELDALRVTAAHEFFHALQFSYYQGSDGGWWQEATATWMEEVAFGEADDYLQYLCDFLLSPTRALDSSTTLTRDNHVYGASVFAHFLEQRYHRDVVRWIWEELGRQRDADLSHFDRMLRLATDGGLDEAISDFGVWNYFTGERHRQGFYDEGAKYPAFFVQPVEAVAKVAVGDTGRVDHLASAYIVIEPELRPGGVVIETQLPRFQWRRQLLLVSLDSVEVRPLDLSTPIEVGDWHVYDEVVVVITSTALVGIGLEYTASVSYDPDLGGDRPSPLALSLGQNYPNPFRPNVESDTIVPYRLNAASETTSLSIFAADGKLVRFFDLGARSPRAYRQQWDGRNEIGQLVGSGIYYYVLESNGSQVRKTLALLRD